MDPVKVTTPYLSTEHTATSESDNNNSVKQFRWNSELQIRFITPGKNFDYQQPLIDQLEIQSNMTPTIYLMLSSVALDTSRQELLYKTYWSHPLSSND